MMRFDNDDHEGEENTEIRMEAMIDCVFLLLIFFLTTTAFIKLEQDLTINLPTMSEELKVKAPPTRPVVVNVRELPGNSVQYVVDNEQITLSALTVQLSRAHVRNKDQSVVIRGDRNVKWDQIAAVMASAAQAGITKVSATVQVEEG